jgi:hypothetical protein
VRGLHLLPHPAALAPMVAPLEPARASRLEWRRGPGAGAALGDGLAEGCWASTGVKSLLSRDASCLSDSVPPLGFVRQEPPEFLGSGALHNYASRNEMVTYFLISNDFVERLVPSCQRQRVSCREGQKRHTKR